MKIMLLLLVILLTGCATVPEKDQAASEVSRDQTNDVSPDAQRLTEQLVRQVVKQEQNEHQGTYDFQHKLLPEWTHHSNGQFYAMLAAGDTERMRAAATEFVDAEYAAAIEVTPITGEDAFLLTFPEPKTTPLCYYAIIHKLEDGTFGYITYEKAFVTREDQPYVGVVGSWSGDGAHGNYGPRTYSTADEFVEDIFGDD